MLGPRREGARVSKTEDKLAEELKKRNLPYKRQIKIGIYRVDFYIPPLIVIDIYGPHHEEFLQTAWDDKRLAYLRSRGLRVYIFSASEVYKSPRKYAGIIAAEYRRLEEEKLG